MHPANIVVPYEDAVVTPPVMSSSTPVQVTCGNCRRGVTTYTFKQNGALAYILTFLVCIICCPLMWLPLCLDSCKDVHHSCPHCGSRLGTYKKL